MKIYNTLTRKKETLKPIKKDSINFFVCGPTVYDYIHIGNIKTFVQFDVIVKYLRYKKFKVNYIQNITDIDDKIIKTATEQKKTPKQVSDFCTQTFLEDIKSYNITSVNKYIPATKHIQEIINQIQILVKKGYAYETEDGVYFRVKKFKEYGKLSHQNIKKIKQGARVEVNEKKENPLDFVLWKKYKAGEPFWDSPYGKGRPGWHIEDTAITNYYFGPQYDIHGGGEDLTFPHHEAEIAQMESASEKKPLVKYWMHTAFLNLKKEKMSKSLGNNINAKTLRERYDPKIVRYLFVSNHYRTPLEFSEESIEQAKNSLDRLNDFIRYLKRSKEKDKEEFINKTRKEFIKAMDDDFDTPKACAVLFNFVRETYKLGGGKESLRFMKEIDKVFTVLAFKESTLEEGVKKLVEEREKARKNKDFKKADRIREELRKKGITVEDTQEGVTWKVSS